jgi:hypothetical protein
MLSKKSILIFKRIATTSSYVVIYYLIYDKLPDNAGLKLVCPIPIYFILAMIGDIWEYCRLKKDSGK